MALRHKDLGELSRIAIRSVKVINYSGIKNIYIYVINIGFVIFADHNFSF